MSDGRDADDARLLARGEHARLLAVYEPVVVARCVAGLRGHPDAEDIAQDVKLRIWRELAAGRRYPVPFRVVVHKVIGWTLADYFARRPTHLPLPEGWDPADPGDGLEALLDRDAVSSRLDGLSGKTREVLELRYREGLEIDQIAERLGMSRNAVDQALHRGHRKLREALTGG